MSDPMLDRSIGALLGLAIGDALGAPFEGLDRDSYHAPRDVIERDVLEMLRDLAEKGIVTHARG